MCYSFSPNSREFIWLIKRVSRKERTVFLKPHFCGAWTCIKHTHFKEISWFFCSYTGSKAFCGSCLHWCESAEQSRTGRAHKIDGTWDWFSKRVAISFSGSSPARGCYREIITGQGPGASVSSTKGINRHCVFLLQMRKMTWREGICLVQNCKSWGQRKQRERLPQRGHCPSGEAQGWVHKGRTEDAALQLLGRGDPAYFCEAWTMRGHSKGWCCLFLEKGKYFRDLLLLGKMPDCFFRGVGLGCMLSI